MSNNGLLSLSSTTAGGIVVVHIDGILDATTREQFSDYLDTVAEDHGPDMILDLGKVTFMDSRALGLIVHHWQRSTTAGGNFALVSVQYPSSKVMWVTGLSQRLPLFDTLDEALAAFTA
ncbi:STAS domain-containing protein [Planotetraspora sp. A-T 1434]|uniref:STAS domain-containing protein n=1 Tax=Planotetraspora sp. A-T 1434 TaxID=2979219 RepID=UPI0021BEC585|nr:STAS domain-containing protein [Planotetraspora sp. A-T 1434]MCT9930449.1 STAS domain-containing protein [Planotetraspora sp. A-T 1434]